MYYIYGSVWVIPTYKSTYPYLRSVYWLYDNMLLHEALMIR